MTYKMESLQDCTLGENTSYNLYAWLICRGTPPDLIQIPLWTLDSILPPLPSADWPIFPGQFLSVFCFSVIFVNDNFFHFHKFLNIYPFTGLCKIDTGEAVWCKSIIEKKRKEFWMKFLGREFMTTESDHRVQMEQVRNQPRTLLSALLSRYQCLKCKSFWKSSKHKKCVFEFRTKVYNN